MAVATSIQLTYIVPGIGLQSPSPAPLGAEVDFTAVVIPATGPPPTTGSVTFTRLDTPNVTLGVVPVDNTGTATLSVIGTIDAQNDIYLLPFGSNQIQATYNPTGSPPAFASSSTTLALYIFEGMNTGTVILNALIPIPVVFPRKGRTSLTLFSTGANIGPDAISAVSSPTLIHPSLNSGTQNLPGYEGAIYAIAINPTVAEQGIILVDRFHAFLTFIERYR